MRTLKFFSVVIIGLFLTLLVSTVFAQSYNQQKKVSPYVLEKLKEQETIKLDIYFNDDITNLIDSNKIIEIHDETITAELNLDEIKTLEKRKEVDYIAPYIELYPILQDSVQIIDADLVWQKQVSGQYLTGEGQTVCVIDFAVDFTHPDLEEKNVAGGIFDCTQSENCPLVENPIITFGHGTHVAGIAAASGGINGISKGSDLISINVYPENSGATNSLYVTRAVNWCANHSSDYNISVITISIGSSSTYENECNFIYPQLTASINNASSLGIPTTIGSGNNGNPNEITYPSCISEAISVGATNKDDTLASYSNYNELVKLFAPGSGINSTCLNGNYCLSSGTSMSTPMVAGSISIMKQYLELKNKEKTTQQIENILFLTGEPINNLPSDYSRININNAIDFLEQAIPRKAIEEDFSSVSSTVNEEV